MANLFDKEIITFDSIVRDQEERNNFIEEKFNRLLTMLNGNVSDMQFAEAFLVFSYFAISVSVTTFFYSLPSFSLLLAIKYTTSFFETSFFTRCHSFAYCLSAPLAI